jgi:CRISPR-associated protein Cas5d
MEEKRVEICNEKTNGSVPDPARQKGASMQPRYPPLAVRIWGDYALFTRPEHKAERVSYPILTPSAARGILENLLWKPEMFWRVEQIHVLKPIRYFSILRNEINHRQSEVSATNWERNGGGYDATDRDNRAQRHSLALYKVDYIIHAQIEVKPGVDADPAKYRDQFRRRVEQGRCFATPYLGCREFSASFAPPDGTEQPIDLSDDFGLMLLDLVYEAGSSGRGTPRFFNARLEGGVLHVPWSERQEA